ncbi:MAG TPA: helix-turn-helix domain-containing protein [Acetobacteraceae bacterium]|nr:helix-turn-helix domain-containing protein [Acetobacteraceae bacterium]
MTLFAEQGYDATTLEAIAEASGISPRTFFYYFKTKDEILQYWQGTGFAESVAPMLLAQPANKPPLYAVRDTFMTLLASYQNEKSLIVDRIYNSSETLRVRKQGFYLHMEQTVFATLCERDPRPERRAHLRMIAMVALGAFRLAMEARRNDTQTRPVGEYLAESFAVLEAPF